MAEGPNPGEMILGKHGQWLGAFDTEYVVPVDTTRFSLRYPLGWTNASWMELGGCNVHAGGCVCHDCCGDHVGNLYDQRHPGDTIEPCWSESASDGWGVSINPKICQEGCSDCIGPGFCSCPPQNSIVCGHICGGGASYAGWPLSEFGSVNPSADIRVVTDTTGPPGLEDMKAMRIDFSGVGAEGATFIGEGGGYDTGRPPFTNSSTPPADDYLNYTRSATGINLDPGDCIRFSCWVKPVPDRYGYTCTGYGFTAILNYGGAFKDYFASFPLTSGWQHVQGEQTIPLTAYPPGGRPMINTLIHLITGTANTIDPRDICDTDPNRSVQKPRGRVHVKAVHLSPCHPAPKGPVHVWRRH